MKALLIGCGAVGLGIAASLYDAGVSLDLIAPGKTGRAIAENGIERRNILKNVKISAEKAHVFENVGKIVDKQYDYIIISAKTTAADSVAKEIGNAGKILADNGKIVLFQNGFGNERPYLVFFTKEQIYHAYIRIGFQRPERNISEITVYSEPMKIGSLFGGDEKAVEPLAGAIDRGGIPCVTTKKIGKDLWAKMLYNCTLNPLSAILNVEYGKLIKSPDTIDIMDHIIEEIFAVMAASGYDTYWEDAKAYKKDFYEKILPPTYRHRSSTLQDVERKIKTEIETLNGVVVRMGEENGVPTPYNRIICNLIRAKECFY